MNLHGSDTLRAPCPYMEPLLQQTADGTAFRLMKWYAMFHVSGCVHCRTYLERLEETLAKLQEAREAEQVPEDVLKRLEQGAWRSIQ